MGRFVTKKYAFEEKNIPREAEWYEVIYGFDRESFWKRLYHQLIEC